MDPHFLQECLELCLKGFATSSFAVERGVRQEDPLSAYLFIETVHSPLFFRKMVEIEGFALRVAIFHQCQNYLRRGYI